MSLVCVVNEVEQTLLPSCHQWQQWTPEHNLKRTSCWENNHRKSRKCCVWPTSCYNHCRKTQRTSHPLDTCYLCWGETSTTSWKLLLSFSCQSLSCWLCCFQMSTRKVPVTWNTCYSYCRDANSQLKAVGTTEIPIQWRNDRETTFQMLVVPRQSWPILFGENHLHSTQALVDHGDPSILFRHPSMSFKIACFLDSPIWGGLYQRDNTHAGVTCLLTGAPSPGIPFPSSKLNRGLNFVSVCLTLGTSLMAVSPSDLRVDG